MTGELHMAVEVRAWLNVPRVALRPASRVVRMPAAVWLAQPLRIGRSVIGAVGRILQNACLSAGERAGQS
jgi:hypothetical protein